MKKNTVQLTDAEQVAQAIKNVNAMETQLKRETRPEYYPKLLKDLEAVVERLETLRKLYGCVLEQLEAVHSCYPERDRKTINGKIAVARTAAEHTAKMIEEVDSIRWAITKWSPVAFFEPEKKEREVN